jgi:hypothetical protein
MDIHESVHMIEQIGRNRVRHALGQIAARISRKSFVEVRLSMLFGRLAIEHRNRKRIAHRDGGNATAQGSAIIKRREQLTHRHQRRRFISVHRCENAKGRTISRAGE